MQNKNFRSFNGLVKVRDIFRFTRFACLCFGLMVYFPIGSGFFSIISLIYLGVLCFHLVGLMQHLDNARGLHEFVLGVGKSSNKHEEKMNGDELLCLEGHSWSSQ